RPRQPARGVPVRAALPVRRRRLVHEGSAAAPGDPPDPLGALGASGERARARPRGGHAMTTAPTNGDGPLLEVTGLEKYFPVRSGILIERTVDWVKAVDGVDLTIAPGETLGLVGESGSGKSTTGYCILQLLKPTGGSVKFQGRELTGLKREELRRVRR